LIKSRGTKATGQDDSSVFGMSLYISNHFSYMWLIKYIILHLNCLNKHYILSSDVIYVNHSNDGIIYLTGKQHDVFRKSYLKTTTTTTILPVCPHNIIH